LPCKCEDFSAPPGAMAVGHGHNTHGDESGWWLQPLGRELSTAFAQYVTLLLIHVVPHSGAWHTPLHRLAAALSECRKVWRLGRWWSPLRRVCRMPSHDHVSATQVLERLANFFCLQYFALDNVIFLAGTGIIRSKMQDFGRGRRNGWLVRHLGGISQMKRSRNFGSLARILCMLPFEFMMLLQCCYFQRHAAGEFGWSTAAAAHTVEFIRSLFHLAILRLKIRSNVAASAALKDGHDAHHTTLALPLLGVAALLLGYLRKLQQQVLHAQQVEKSRKESDESTNQCGHVLSSASLLSVDSLNLH